MVTLARLVELDFKLVTRDGLVAVWYGEAIVEFQTEMSELACWNEDWSVVGDMWAGGESAWMGKSDVGF